MKNFVIIPSYNEGQRAVKTLKEVLKQTQSPVIVVDDGSRDKDAQLLKKACAKHARVSLIRHELNQGKGAAMRAAAHHAWQNQADNIIFIDADGQHDPKFLLDFEEALKKNQLVFGYRLLKTNVPIVRKLGNQIIRVLVRWLFGIRRHDLLCGFFGLSKKRYRQLEWHSSRYGVETELAARVGSLRLPFIEIKINTTYLGKKHGMSYLDAIKILLKIPGWYFGVF